jgi:hypothetical protein
MGGGFLEVLQDSEVAEIHAVGALDAALESVEGLEGVLIGMAEGRIVLDGLVEILGGGEVVVEALDLVIPELGFDAAEAALGPLGGDEGIDQGALVGVGGLVMEEEFGGKVLEFARIFAANDVRPGVDAGLEGVQRGGGFAFGGSGAGRFLGITAVGFNLSDGRHKWFRVGLRLGVLSYFEDIGGISVIRR